MPFLNLAATPAVRFPDPLEKRVSPNGVQPYSAYNAVYLYYDPTLGKWRDEVAPPANGGELRPIETLLFGTDYPALVTATSYYGENSNGPGFYLPTFTESSPLLGSYGVSSLQYIMPTAAPVGYKQIATGLTATNGVRVQGFPQLINLLYHGVVQGDDPPTADAPCLLGLSVVMNAAVVNSSTSFYKVDAGVFPNLPVIIHEKDLTQTVIDNGYVILGQTVEDDIFGTLTPTITANLDVVGIWATDYDPLNP